MDIKTLHEFMLTTEGYSYLIGVGSVISFTVFWVFLNKKPNKDK